MSDQIMQPKISVVIPVYKTENYIQKCLESVVNQTFYDIEIICVDDFSPDNSIQIIQQFIEKDKRVKLISHKNNKGQGGARNSGIKAAKGLYIASIDSDDSMNSRTLERLWEESEDGSYDVVCCGFKRVDLHGNIISQTLFESKILDNYNNDINIFTAMNPAIWNKLWRKTLFTNNDIYFPERIYYQDMATIPLLLSKSNKVKYIEDCLFNYLVRDGSVTNTYSAKHIIDYLKVYEILYEALKKNKLIKRYSKDLINYISNGMRFHSTNVFESEMTLIEKKRYLRTLLLFKVSFQENYNSIRNKGLNSLYQSNCNGFSSNYNTKYIKINKRLKKTKGINDSLTNDLKNTRNNLIKTEDEKSTLFYKISKLDKEVDHLEKQKNELLLQRERLKKEKIELLDKIRHSEFVIGESLSMTQGFWVTIYSIIVKLVLSKKQKLKLKETPKRFFSDSSSKFTKNFGLFFKIIDN